MLRGGLAALLLLAACSAQAPQPEQAGSGAPVETAGLTDPQTKLRAARVISTFENSTTDIQYDYAENISDGRGITAGRAGADSRRCVR